MTESRSPRVVVVATGGTIAGAAASGDGRAYVAGSVGIDAMLAAVPGLTEIAEVVGEQLFAIDSVEMDLSRQVVLARRLRELMADPGVDGVVVTHGTDTMEETSYLLALTLDATKPVVLVGAMRPADALSADGPANLRNAVRVAASPRSVGHGVLVVFGEEIHGGREIRKRHASRVNAFESAHGPVGEIAGGVPVYYQRGLRGGPVLPLPDGPLPQVEVLVSRAELPVAIVSSYVDAGAVGIVHAGPGGGNVPEAVLAALDEARRRGVAIVRASRVGAGHVGRNGCVDDDAHDFVAAGDLSPYKARILLTLALSLAGPADTARLQDFFDTY